jgi:glycosyltransferase XagB
MSLYTVGGNDRTPAPPWNPPLAHPVGFSSPTLAWPHPTLLPEVPVGISEAEMLHISVFGLRDRDPSASSSTSLSRGQKAGVTVIGLSIVAGFVFRPLLMGIILIMIAMIFYLASLSYRVVLYLRSLSGSEMVRVSDEAALAVPEHDLPTYTIMVPAYNEPEVIEALVRALDNMAYPKDKLDIKLLLEADDTKTVIAARWAVSGKHMEIVTVPAADPRTKPKALNFGLQTARGEFVTVYDAEDRPEPLQLRKAVLAMRAAPEELGCLQARLSYFNPNQNLLTRWFTLEYATWFAQFLPGLVMSDAPVPLGGTSNHFRRQVIEDVGGWDPFNVTEDADLGMRLHRQGFRTAILDSVTWEEANSDVINWIKQRSRWYKGYIQTWAVHLRHPVTLYRQLGPRAFLEFNLFVGGTPLLALLNPVFWGMTILWFVSEPVVIQDLLPRWIYYLSLLCWLFGNFALTYLNLMMAQSMVGKHKFHRAALLTPLYWIMMSIAAVKAAVQFVFQPSHWEKTIHGLSGKHDTTGLGPPS